MDYYSWVLMSVRGAEVQRASVTCQGRLMTLCLIFEGTLWNVVRDFDIPVIHPFPDDLEGLFAFHPLFDNDHAVTRQNGKDELPGIFRVLEGSRAREGLLNGAILRVCGTGNRVVEIAFRYRDIFD